MKHRSLLSMLVAVAAWFGLAAGLVAAPPPPITVAAAAGRPPLLHESRSSSSPSPLVRRVLDGDLQPYQLVRVPLGHGTFPAPGFVEPYLRRADDDWSWRDYGIYMMTGQSLHTYQISAKQGGYTFEQAWLAPDGWQPGQPRTTELRLWQLLRLNWQSAAGRAAGLSGLDVVGIESITNKETVAAMKKGYSEKGADFTSVEPVSFQPGDEAYKKLVKGPLAKSILKLCANSGGQLRLREFIVIGGLQKGVKLMNAKIKLIAIFYDR